MWTRRLKRCTAWLLLVATLALALPVTAFAADTIGTVNCSSLNLRSEASTNSKALQTLSKGTKVTIKGTTGDWYKVVYGKYTGFVMKKYITKGGSTSNNNNNNNNGGDTMTQLRRIGKPSPCKPGDRGSNVTKLQKCLAVLGFYSGAIDGDYGNGTTNAVKKFQKSRKLTQDGVAGSNTINVMFGGTSNNDGKKATERLDWFHGGSNVIPKGATFTVKDVRTGKTFKCKRWSGANHMDSEPLTADDTRTMKSIYGSWSWNRRPILVLYNGHVYAGSMNGMPHGTTTIKNNNFDGHFCIHFYGSKTHGTQVVDSNHQSCVATAMKYSW
ncbi:MAG: peptidoglycan-binding protein [Clostridia bacterium]|nr:peptidoglycan-binding protein [Clostridia bacterium]